MLAQREGRLIQLRVEEGARVSQGAELAQLNEDDLRAQLRQAQLEVERLLIEEGQYDALVKVSRTELEQERARFKDGLTSQRQLDRASFKLEGAIHELEKTKLATQAARAKLEAAKLELDKCIIRAPFSGVITRVYTKLGTSIVRGDKLFEVGQLAPLVVKFQLPAAEPAPPRMGSLLGLALADSNRIIAQARVRRLAPIAEAESNTRGYLAELAGNSGLIPGMSVNVVLARAATATTSLPRIVFPANIELRPGTAGAVFVLDGEEVRRRSVRVQAVEGDLVVVSNGLAAGDRVIVAPAGELKEGTKARVK